MAKDKTLHGLITVVLLQLCCAMARSSNVKDGNKFTRDNIFKVRNAANKETNLPDFNMLQIRHLPLSFHSQGSKQGQQLNTLLWKMKKGMHFVNTNTKQGEVNTLSRKINSVDDEHTYRIKPSNGAKSTGSSLYGKTMSEQTYERLKSPLSDPQYGLPLIRQRRSTQNEYSHTRAQRKKRDFSGDTQVGLIFGACILGLLTAFLLICACMRCNAVRKSEDGKTTIPDYTPTLFAVAKGYDNVAFDTDEMRNETPSNEIPMKETISNEETIRTASVPTVERVVIRVG